MTDHLHYLQAGLANAREASRELANCDDAQICKVLESLATRAIEAEEQILRANLSDLSRMSESDPKYDLRGFITQAWLQQIFRLKVKHAYEENR